MYQRFAVERAEWRRLECCFVFLSCQFSKWDLRLDFSISSVVYEDFLWSPMNVIDGLGASVLDTLHSGGDDFICF